MRNRGISLIAVLLTVTVQLSACSSGGGSGGAGISGGGSVSTGLSYTGVTAPAVISTSNAEILALESFANGMEAGASQNVATTMAVVDSTTTTPDVGVIVSRLVSTFQTAAQGLVTTTASGNSTTLVSIQQTMAPMTGSCGGTASGMLTIDDVTTDNYAIIVFDNYCESGVTLSGEMSFTLILDTTNPDYGLMTMNFTNVQVNDTLNNVVITGSVQYDSMALNPDISINMLLQTISGRVFKMKDFVITMVSGINSTGAYTDISMNGRLYDPDYGYVDLTTTLPLKVYAGDNWPSSGSYTLTGAGNATVTLTATPEGYQLDLDLDGDGIDDGTPLTGIWFNIRLM